MTPTTEIALEASVSHTLLERRSIVTIVLHGGDLPEREEVARAIMAQLAPQYPVCVSDRPAALTSVFALLSRPPEATGGSDVAMNVQANQAPTPLTFQANIQNGPSSESVSAYDELFVLAPIR